ncbi:tyrosine-protein phosphatase [Candidatus Lokiarchaeum ossiferum]|uniref:tyrosine-protein phosphatase n=1 Tax=Candidatus Lokiarchaeum ossiferum TaxID=2951803 RepID=UPI00352F0486
MRRILCKNVSNMRDIGGIQTKSGYFIKEYRFIRSNLPVNIDQSEKEFLLEKKITTVIDLREPDDVKNNQNHLHSEGFFYHNIPTKGSGFPESEELIPLGYIEILNDFESIRKILTRIAEAPAGVLINCNAGKDRTGIIIMLLLLIADVDEKEICEDYEISATNLYEQIKALHEKYSDLPSFVGQSKKEYILKTLSLFKEKFDNIDHYLKLVALDDENIRKIKNKLLK